MTLTWAMRRYAAEIYRLQEDTPFVPPSLLADHVDVSHQAVDRMLRRLRDAGLLSHERYRGVRLTAEGERAAMPALRRHRLVEVFLVKVLGYGWHEVHDHAEHLERGIDDDLEVRVDELAGHPSRCPHGEPIPDAAGRIQPLSDVCLTTLPLGAHGAISRVRTHDPDKLVYLREIGLVPGVAFSLEERAPFEGPLRLAFAGGSAVLGHRLAATLWVDADAEPAAAAQPLVQ
jgi:DtxR family Mn-dependent transcriptional regulator